MKIRIPLIALALAAGVLIALWIAGGKTYEIAVARTVPASPETVFSYLTEPDKVARWVDGVESIRILTEGDYGVGTRAEITMRQGGREFVLLDEVTGFDADRFLMTKLTGPHFLVTSNFHLAPRDGGTFVIQQVESTYRGWLRPLAPLIQSIAQQRLENALQALEEAVTVREK